MAAESPSDIADIVRRYDRDAWLASLFVREPARRDLHALHAFASEIDRIRVSVSDPTVGEIRLQWWRDTLAAGVATGHPVADAIVTTAGRLASAPAMLDRYLEARIFDLYDDPMTDIGMLEAYAGETASALLHLGATALDAEAASSTTDASGYGGVALTILRLLVDISHAPARFQPFVPADLVARHDAHRSDFVMGKATPEIAAALAELRSHARNRLAEAVAAVQAAPPQVQAAYLPLATVGPMLDRLDNRAEAPFSPARDLSPVRRQWLIWRAARRWG